MLTVCPRQGLKLIYALTLDSVYIKVVKSQLETNKQKLPTATEQETDIVIDNKKYIILSSSHF